MDKALNIVLGNHIRRYGRSIIETLEEVLKELGAENIKIGENVCSFSKNEQTRAINLTELMRNIFCIGSAIDINCANEEFVYTKTLQEIQTILAGL